MFRSGSNQSNLVWCRDRPLNITIAINVAVIWALTAHGDIVQ
jgi:hypothetical protein